MKIEPQCYQITFPDGDVFFIDRMFQTDGSILWRIIEDPTGYCLNKDLKWIFEPSPSNRTDEYLKSTRFKYDEAIETLIRFKESEGK